MTNSERYHFDDFTRENYSRLIELAKRQYVFKRFTDYAPHERFALWRHDVDFSPQAAVRLAEREARAGVPATYFVSLHSEFYNLLERDVTESIRELIRLGHDVGLHFDPDYDQVRDTATLVSGLARERRILDDLLGRPTAVFSFHNPTAQTRAWDAAEYDGMINAAAAYFYTDVGFCSDSNGYWRDRRLEDVLTQATDQRLQVLTHPEMWQDTPMSPRQRVQRCIDGRAHRTIERYEKLLRENGRDSIGPE